MCLCQETGPERTPLCQKVSGRPGVGKKVAVIRFKGHVPASRPVDALVPENAPTCVPFFWNSACVLDFALYLL